MAVENFSSNKIRVTKLFGSDSYIGLMDPMPNMVVKNGIDTRWIVHIESGHTPIQVGLALSSGGIERSRAYPHELYIEKTVASGWGFPTADGSVLFGHLRTFPSGVPTVSGAGTTYLDGTGTPKTVA